MGCDLELAKVVAAVAIPNIPSFVIASLKSNRDSLKEWYPTLNFPKFKPPNYLFGPVWVSLYSGMGYASYLVYKSGGGFNGAARLPLALYGTQLALNWAWTPIFFIYRQPGWAALELGVLCASATATAVAFRNINSTAGCLMAPYLAWLGFAFYLNFNIWRLNKKDKAIEGKKSD